MTKPVRLQISRQRGFNLQELSRATNGLPAVNVARPSKWGNPYYIINEEGFPWVTDARDATMPALNRTIAAEAIGGLHFENAMTWEEARQSVVALYRQRCVDTVSGLDALRGKNLACWCAPGAPCHADVLLEIANK